MKNNALPSMHVTLPKGDHRQADSQELAAIEEFPSSFPPRFLRYLIVPAWFVQLTKSKKVKQKCPRSTFL
jgi:hypothetical protein